MENNPVPKYECLSLRGNGAFGYVLEAYDQVHDRRVAIKRTHKVGNKISREYEILSQINECEFVVKMLDSFYSVDDSGKLVQNLVFEYVTRNLDAYIQEFSERQTSIPINEIKRITKEMLMGLNYCHQKNIVHRDLKPENILFSDTGHVKICDFGSSKKIDSIFVKSTPYMVSRYYRAPELLLGESQYDSSIDIFAAGCIFAEMFMKTPLFQGSTEGMQLFEHLAVLGTPNKGYFNEYKDIPQEFRKYFEEISAMESLDLKILLNPQFVYSLDDANNAADLLKRMICWVPSQRISASLALQHPFLKGA
ncbi:MAG: protein kinase [archaeon]|nr:protein kinase [archaeon]